MINWPKNAIYFLFFWKINTLCGNQTMCFVARLEVLADRPQPVPEKMRLEGASRGVFEEGVLLPGS